MENNKAFTQHRTNGFYLQFPNGNGISTIWGAGSHTENNDHAFQWLRNGSTPSDFDKMHKAFSDPLTSDDVEIMPDCSPELMEELKKAYPDEEDGIIFNHLNITQWLDILNRLRR